jgi:chemotaxis signal transduction protein
VLDLRLFFDIPLGEQETPPGELILVRANQLEIGLLATHVEGVMTIPHAAIEPMEDTRYALGVTRERLVVLDIEQIFADERLIIGGGED